MLSTPMPMLRARLFSSSSSARNMAKLTLIGRVGAQPEAHTTQAGVDMVRYVVAVNGPKERVNWYRIACFETNSMEYIQKNVHRGSLVYVEGLPNLINFVDDEGVKHRDLQIAQRRAVCESSC